MTDDTIKAEPEYAPGTEYIKGTDCYKEVAYHKHHADGRTTQVHIEGRFGEWVVYVMDRRGDREIADHRIGTPEHKTRAGGKVLAEKWMQENPEGLCPEQ